MEEKPKKARAYKPYVPVPDAERCECCTSGSWHRARCDKRSKFVVTGQKWQWPDKLVGDPRAIRVCGVHKRQADKGRRLMVYTGPKQGYGSVQFEEFRTEATEVEKLKSELESTERTAKWKRGEPNEARSKAGREVWEQAPEILEMLFMVAERGDDRAWKAIHTIQDGMTRVEQADKAYQNMVDRIEALKARLEQAKEEQADGKANDASGDAYTPDQAGDQGS